MTWETKETTEVIPEDIKAAGLRVFEVFSPLMSHAQTKWSLVFMVTEPFDKDKYIVDIYSNFPLDDEDQPKAYKMCLEFLKKTLAPKQLLSFIDDPLGDIARAGVLTKGEGCFFLVKPTEEEILRARDIWKTDPLEATCQTQKSKPDGTKT